MRDGTGILQCVAVKSALPEETFEALKDLTQESSLTVRGKIRAEARAPGGYELDVESAHIVQRVPEDRPYPITPKDHGVDFLMDHRHLWLRSRRQHAALLVRHEVIKGIREYFDSHGFVLVDTPIFTPAACEGTSTLFEVNYFDEEKVYLAQSGQLYNEATGDGVRQDLLLRSDVPRREIQDAAAPHGILDGGAGDGLRRSRRRQARGRRTDRFRGRAACSRIARKN